MKRQRRQRGSTLFIVAGSLVILLGMGALAIDLASLYVAHNEAQRAADAGALAGAKVFVESGCVTSGNCGGEEGVATDRATQAAEQVLVGGQAPTVSNVTFNEVSQDPQITVQVQSANLAVYFAGIVGFATAPTVGATATAEAWNPSGGGGGTTYCTSCVRPWLIPNGPTPLLNADSTVHSPGCVTAGGVVGQAIPIALDSQYPVYAPVDVDNGTGNPADYQQGITTCFTGQQTCGGTSLSIMPNSAVTQAATVTGVENLLHIAATGMNQQDTIDTTVCPPQIHAGGLNPLVTNGVVAQGAVISTSDSIVTAYIYNGTLLNQTVPQPVNIVGFAQIFVTQADPVNNGDVDGVILGVAGCGTNAGGCNAGAIQGPTMLPVRLITSGN